MSAGKLVFGLVSVKVMLLAIFIGVIPGMMAVASTEIWLRSASA